MSTFHLQTKIMRLVAASLTVLCAGSAYSATKFYVPINRSEVLTTNKILGEVIVANPEIADIFVHGQDTVSVIGKRLGSTTVRLFDQDSALVREMDVYVTYDLPAIRKALHEFLPFEKIGVEMVNTNIALTGEVSSAEAANSALEIASQFLTPSQEPEEIIEQGDSDVVEQRLNSIVNLMRVSSGQQVMLRIRLGEMQRNTLKQLSTDFGLTRTGNQSVVDIFAPSSLTDLSEPVRGVTGAFTFGRNQLNAALAALEQNNLLKVLAEPNLVALSGEEAQFLSGGEIPIPIAQQNGTLSVEFRPFGVSLRFTPYVLSENRIRIQVQPEVSRPTEGGAIGIGNGITIPAFDVQRASTTVELAPGESFMIAGLLQDRFSTTIDDTPGISEIPVLSSFFRSSESNRQESELVIAVTPYLVDPLKSSDVRLPVDDFRPASFMETVLYGALGSLQNNERRLSQTPSLEGPVGFMVD